MKFVACAAEMAVQEIPYIYGDTAPRMPAITSHSNPADVALLYRIIDATRRQRKQQLGLEKAKGPTMAELQEQQRNREQNEARAERRKQRE